MKELNVGDKVLVVGRDYRRISEIIEITKAGNYRIEDRRLFDRFGKLRGASIWEIETISPITDEGIEEFRKEVRTKKAETKRKAFQQELIDFMINNKVPYETLEEIFETVKNSIE